MAALISGEVQVGFMGPEATIYVYNEGGKDQPINFAQVTQRDGSFLVSKNPNPDFKFSDLSGSEIIGGRKGGVPEMTLEYVLKANGLDARPDDETAEDDSVQIFHLMLWQVHLQVLMLNTLLYLNH